MSEEKDNIDTKKLPTDQKIVHKGWNTRKMGYEECIKLFKTDDPNDPDFTAYLELIKGFTNDPNEAARDKGLEAVILYLENAAIAHKCVPDILIGIFSKCLTSKQVTREKAMRILHLCVELDQHLIVQEKLIEGITNKQPKIIQTSLEVLRTIISDYGGPKVIQFKPVIKELANAIEHRDKSVRDEAKFLAIEMYKWNSKQFMKDLRECESKLQEKVIDNLEKDLDEAKQIAEKPIQKKFRKSEAKQREDQEKKQKAEEDKKAKLEAEKRAKEEVRREEEEKNRAIERGKLEEEERERKLKIKEEEDRKAKLEEEKRAKAQEEVLLKLKAENEEKEKIEAKLKSTAAVASEQPKLDEIPSSQSQLKINEKKKDLKSILTNPDTFHKLKNETLNNNNNKDDIDKALLNCLIKDCRPISDFHKPGMLKFLQTILPGYTPPSRSFLNKKLEQMKQDNDTELNKLLKDITDIALSTELFKNSRNSYYLCLRGHYFDKKFQYKSIVISFKRFIQSEHLSIKINSFIKYELNRLQITNKVRTITTNNTDFINKATKNNDFGTRISCLVDNLNSTIIEALLLDSNKSKEDIHICDKDYYDDEHYITDDEHEDNKNEPEELIYPSEDENEQDDLSEYELVDSNSYNPDEVTSKTLSHLINKIRHTVRLILNSNISNIFVRNEAQKANLKLKLSLDLPLRWHTTFVMMDRFIKHMTIIESLTSTKNPLVSNKRFQLLKELKLNKNEWILLKSLVEVLQPFSKAVVLISSRDYHPLSLSQVISSSLKRFLTEKTINVHVNSIKEILFVKFKIYFETNIDSKERSLRLMATYLNPLHFRCLNEMEKNEAEQLLIKEESEVSNKFSMFSLVNNTVAANKLKKQETFDVFKDFINETGPDTLNQLSNTENSHLTFKEEMAYYVASLKRNGVFDDFWNQEKQSLPKLYALVKRISSSPISCSDTRNSFTSNSYVQRKQLSNLNPKNLYYSFILKDISN